MPATVQKPSAPTLPETGFLRLSDVLRFVPVCRTAWYNGVKSGLFPQPVALGKRASCGRCARPDRPSQCR